ncbi:cell wall-binding repeat-containing protein [Desulfosporosinus shakirovi]|uniref:cell wall-binding repeat-containing protein n=1 Tax=Desulfosporosinus shakirovi TaxID=2885154 RepID=UPI001E49E4A3|nr:cell wall-binding repeat-containing protein [Desulfosporosinus sp. SRJS8]MCB8817453.1 cell wall-binding repeat-containing protein [Desulfosporosinus sp. SRJS8]
MKKIVKQGLGTLMTCLLLISTLMTGLAAEAHAQTMVNQGTVSRSMVDQVINDLEQWERASIQAAFQTASELEIVNPTVYNWPTIGLGRLERYDGLSAYLAENEKYLQQNWSSTLRKVTDLARISLAVGAAQGNPRDYGGKDLIAEIYNYPNIEAQGINGPIFALITLDSGGYELPETAKWTRGKLLDIILNKQLADGGYSLDGIGNGDVDITAMVIQALSPYYKAGMPEATDVVDKAVAYLAQVQESDGGFKSWGEKNSESVCQTIIALCSMGIDIDTDTRFIKNSNSLLNDLLKFKADDGGFKHTLEGSTNSIASEQALIALAAYVRFLDKKSSLYNYHPEKVIPYPTLSSGEENPSSSILGIVRIAGTDCYATAVEIAKRSFPQGAETVILARGDVSADALPAVPLARKYQAPLLLTPSDQLPKLVFNQIRALGAKKVLIMGGEGAISKQVSAALVQAEIEVQRVSGNDHYATAYEIAKLLGSSGQAVIVSGDYVHSFPDALSISAWSAYNNVPILYADGSVQLPKPTQQAISELGIQQTILIGGTDVLPRELEQVLPNPKRYSGQTLYDTNASVLGQLQPNPTKIFVATGTGFADGLAGAAVAGQSNAWILLTDRGTSGGSGLSNGQEQLLRSAHNLSPEIYVLGGAAVVTDSTLQALNQLLTVSTP